MDRHNLSLNFSTLGYYFWLHLDHQFFCHSCWHSFAPTWTILSYPVKNILHDAHGDNYCYYCIWTNNGCFKKNCLCLRVQKIRSMASVAYSFHRSSILHLNSGFWKAQLQQISLSVIPVGIKSSPKIGLFISKFRCYVEFHLCVNAQKYN